MITAIKSRRLHKIILIGLAKDTILSPKRREEGFSLIELIIAMVIALVIMGIAVTAFSSALGSRERESSTTDAISSAQAALNIMSREIGNSGYGLRNNGLVWIDASGNLMTNCTAKRLHFRTNTSNTDAATSGAGENVTFYWDEESKSVVRYDANTGETSGIINRISDVNFVYYNYAPDGTVTRGNASPNTGRITIVLKVILAEVRGQAANQIVTVQSDVTLRNSPYMLGQY
jgi:prepilin-type N-terminal cleavage/methylation domain-containing protein